MTSQYRHRRTSNPATAFPSTLEPGEIAVNTANRQVAVGDANSSTLGAPIALLAVRYFDPRASYASGDMVANGGIIYSANAAVPPGAWNASQWTAISSAAGTYVQKAGDVMTGPLTLSSDPITGSQQATTKTYVDGAIAAKPALYIGDTPPASPPDNALFWESDSGLLFVRYNDGDSAQWVLAMPMPDVNAFVEKAGDTMTGALNVPAPTAAQNAANKNYVDTQISSSIAAIPAPTGSVRYDQAQSLTLLQQQQARSNIGVPAVLRSYLAGLTLSTAGSSATFSVATGIATDSTNTDTMTLAAALSKTTSAWAVGTGNGALDTGGIGNATWYYVYVIQNPSNGVVDVLISLSATSPTLPSSFTRFRRIGAMLTNASGQWTPFTQYGDRFYWVTAVTTLASASLPTGPTAFTFNMPAAIPVIVLGVVTFTNTASAAYMFLFSSVVASASGTNLYATAAGAFASAPFSILTVNGQGLINNQSASGNQVTNYISGWIDRRGRDA